MQQGAGAVFRPPFREASEQLLDALEMDGEFPLARYFLGLVYLQTGQFAEAAEEFEKARETTNGHPAATAGLVAAMAHSGKKAGAKRLLADLQKQADAVQGIQYYVAVAWLRFGDKARALQWLEKACDERSVSVPNISADPIWDTLRSAPAFKHLLRRVGLKSI